MEITNYKEAALLTNEKLSSASFKEFLFGSENVSHRQIKGPSAIYKLMKAEFLLIYLSYLRLSRTEIYSYKGRYFAHVAEAFSRLYHDHSFGLDVVVYVLAEAQKDVIANGEKSFFAPFLSADTVFEYGKIYTLIDKWMNANHNEIAIETILAHYVSVLSLSKGLYNCDIRVDTNEDVSLVTFLHGDTELPAKNLIHADENGYSILVCQTRYTDKIVSDYLTLDNTDHIYVYH